MITTIYDLDGTVIDSAHRYRTLPDGSIDLPAWIRLATRENIMKDTLLPLANLWRLQLQRGHRIIVCTARVMSPWDHLFLRNHGLFSHRILSRPKGCVTSDATLKLEQLSPVVNNPKQTTMYEDHDGVREILSKELGIKCLHPRVASCYNLDSIKGKA